MKAGIIAPVPLLEVYCITDYHLVKPRLVLENQNYRNFYLDRIKRGHTVILDSSEIVPRKSVFPEYLLEALKILNPPWFIAPDRDMSGPRTVKLTTEFLSKYGKQIKSQGVSIIGVIQGHSLEQAIFCYKALNKQVDAFALPKSLEEAIGRAVFLKTVKVKTKPIHILGFNSDPEKEIEDLLELRMPNLVGILCDLPVRLGLQCHFLDEWKPDPPPLDMLSDYNPFQKFTLKNIEEFIIQTSDEVEEIDDRT